MNALDVAWKDIQILLKDRGQVILLFVLPIVFVMAFSAALSASVSSQPAIDVPVVNLDPGGEASQMLIDQLNADRGLKTVEYGAEAQVEADLQEEKIKLALVIPAGFTADVQAGQVAQLRLLRGPGASASEMETVRLVVEGVADDLSLQTQLLAGLSQMGAMMGDAPQEAQAFTAERIQAQAKSQYERAKTAPLVAVATKFPDVMTGGREEFDPSSFGMAGFAILFAFMGAQVTAASIYDEKKLGTFRRLQTSPLSRFELMVGKMLPNFVIALLQVAIIFGLSVVLLPLMNLGAPSLGNDPLALVVVTVVLAVCSTGLGVFIAALARTESQVGGIATVMLWTAGMVGGAFIPAFLLGSFLNTIGKVVPHYWALQAYNDLLIRGKGLVDVLPAVGILAGFALLFLVVGLVKFRFD
jgi:ABC-2 type transport system permease protein